MSGMSAESANPLEIEVARLQGSYEQIDKRLSSLETQISEIRGDLRSFRTDVDAKLDGIRTLIFSTVGALALLVTIFEFVR